MKEQTFSELMVCLRRNCKSSPCIDNFENLIIEINDPRITDVFVSDMSGFISRLLFLLNEVDKLSDTKLKSKIISTTFIEPNRNFTKSEKWYNKMNLLNLAFPVLDKNGFSDIDHIDPNKFNTLVVNILGENFNGLGNNDKEKIKEIIRKAMLLYNHIPAIIKALIQTKRRELGVDSNSQRF